MYSSQRRDAADPRLAYVRAAATALRRNGVDLGHAMLGSLCSALSDSQPPLLVSERWPTVKQSATSARHPVERQALRCHFVRKRHLHCEVVEQCHFWPHRRHRRLLAAASQLTVFAHAAATVTAVRHSNYHCAEGEVSDQRQQRVD